MIRRSGSRGRSARESQMCGVITFCPARYTSVAASPASTWVSEPPRLGTLTVAIQSGKYLGTDFMKKPCASIPLGNACRASGRSRMWGSIAGATCS